MSQQANSPVLDPEVKTKTHLSPNWQVVGIDDDVTPMDYVIMILQEFFSKKHEDAYEHMLEVHETGLSIFYTGPKEICELRVEQVRNSNASYNQIFRVKMQEA